MIEPTENHIQKATGKAVHSWTTQFFSLWISQAISMFGTQLVSFVLIWHLTQTTGSATVLTTTALVVLLPQILLSPFAGVLIDRLSRKGILIATQILIGIVMFVLALLFALGNVNLLHLYGMMFVLGLCSGINYPAIAVATTLLVPERLLKRVQGMNQTLQGGLSIVSAPLGAVLLQALSMQRIFFLMILAPIFATICLFFVTIPRPPASDQNALMVFRQMQAGLHYVLSWPGLRMIIGIAILLNFLDYPAIALTPLLVTKHFNGDALQLGWMNSTFGIGIIIGGLALSAWGGFQRRMATAMSGVIGLGLGAVLIGLTPSFLFWLAMIGIFIKGFMQTIVNGPIVAALQSSVDLAMQGRVISIMVALTLLSAPLGLLVAGPLTERIGVPAWYILLGVACLVVGGIAFFVPTIINFDQKITTKPEEDQWQISY